MAKNKINGTEWYLPYYPPSLEQQKILSKQILCNIPTDLQFVERSIFMKELYTRNLWTLEMGTEEGMNVPIWFFVGFQQRDRRNSQTLNNDTFYRPPVTTVQCIIGTEKYHDTASSLNYDVDVYTHGCGQKKKLLEL